MAVLAVVAWLVWPKPEKLTQAQTVMAQRAAAKSAAPATPAPPATLVVETKVPAAPSRGAAEPTAIKLWDAPEKLPKGGGIRWEDNAMRLSSWGIVYHEHLSRDAIIRASIRMNPDLENLKIALRQSGKSETSEDRHYHLAISAKKGTITVGAHIDSNYPEIKTWPLPRPYGADEWARVELRAVGDALTVSLDGQVLGTVHDSSITEPGGVFLYAGANGYFRDIEYVPLDGAAAAASAPPVMAKEPAAIKLWDSPDKIPKKAGSGWDHDALRLDNSAVQYTSTFSRDAILRAEIRANPEADGPQLHLRGLRSYRGLVDTSYFRCTLWAKAGNVTLVTLQGANTIIKDFGSWKLPRTYGADEWIKLEVRAIGDDVTVVVDGAVLATVHDTSHTEAGGVQLYATANGYFRNIEYVPLDGAAASDSARLSASTEPWQDLLAAPAKLNLSGTRLTPAGVELPPQMFAQTQEASSDGAIRVVQVFVPGENGLDVVACSHQHDPKIKYEAVLYSNGVLVLLRFLDEELTTLRKFPLATPLVAGSDCAVELRKVGQKLTVKLNGVALGDVQLADDPTLKGTFGVGNFSSNTTATAKALQFLPLPSSAKSPVSAAAK